MMLEWWPDPKMVKPQYSSCVFFICKMADFIDVTNGEFGGERTNEPKKKKIEPTNVSTTCIEAKLSVSSITKGKFAHSTRRLRIIEQEICCDRYANICSRVFDYHIICIVVRFFSIFFLSFFAFSTNLESPCWLAFDVTTRDLWMLSNILHHLSLA